MGDHYIPVGPCGFKSTKSPSKEVFIPINIHTLLTLLPPSQNRAQRRHYGVCLSNSHLLSAAPLPHCDPPPLPPLICKTWWSDPSLPRWIPPSPNELRNDVEKVRHHPKQKSTPTSVFFSSSNVCFAFYVSVLPVLYIV